MIIVLLSLLIIWAAIAIKDRVMSRRVEGREGDEPKNCLHRKQAKWCQNFILRFCYVFFLEFCICVSLQLTVQDVSEFSPALQFCLAVALALVFTVFVGFVCSLLCKNGPYARGFFGGTTISSIHGIRQRNQQFDIKKFMVENPKSHMISQFWPYSTLSCFRFDRNQAFEATELVDVKSKYGVMNGE